MRSIGTVRWMFDRATGYGGTMTEAQWLRRFVFLETVAGEASPGTRGSHYGQPCGCSRMHLLLWQTCGLSKPCCRQALGTSSPESVAGYHIEHSSSTQP
jgi:Alternative oxidase